MDSIKNTLHYLNVIWRSKWLVILPAAIFTVIGAFVAWNMPSYYKSQTLILVEKQQIPETYVTPTDKTPFSQRLNTIRQQILSRQNIEKIANDFQLYRNKESANPLMAFINRFREVRQPSSEDIIERMSKDVEVNVIGDRRAGDAFSVSYVGSNPETAMNVTNTLASLFIDENLKAREQYAEGASDFISAELDNAKLELENQERELRGFKERNMGSLPQQLEANLRTLDRLQSEFQSVKNELKTTEDRKLLFESQLGRTSAVPGMPAAPNSLQVELESLQRELTSLLARYKENYPDVVITKNKIEEIKGQLAANRQALSSGSEPVISAQVDPEVYNELMLMKSRIAVLNTRAAEIRKQIQVYERRVESTPGSEQKFIDLRRDYDISLANYQALLEKKMNAKLAENLEKRQKGERFKVIDSANLPEKPFKPNKPAIVLAAAAMGLGLGIGIVLFIEYLNPSFRTRDELAGGIDMAVLATVPAFASSRPEKKSRMTLRVLKRSNGHS